MLQKLQCNYIIKLKIKLHLNQETIGSTYGSEAKQPWYLNQEQEPRYLGT
jgi:hypothetical protein